MSEILKVCAGFEDLAYSVGQEIPDKKLTGAHRSMNIPVGEHVAALGDWTVVGNGKLGFVVAESGLYWRCPFEEPQYITWNALAGHKPVFKDAQGNVTLNGNLIDPGMDVHRELFFNVLNELRGLARKDRGRGSASPRAPFGAAHPLLENAQWRISIKGKVSGPFDTDTIRKIVAGGLIDPHGTYAWREGMRDWLPVAEFPNLMP